MFVLEFTSFQTELFIQYPVILKGPERKIMILKFLTNYTLSLRIIYQFPS